MSTEDRKIVQYTLDEKTYKSLELQFKREYVYNMIYSKILAELAELNKK